MTLDVDQTRGPDIERLRGLALDRAQKIKMGQHCAAEVDLLPPDLAEADRLTPYAAALRYGLGNPEAVAAEGAIRWAALAIKWADAEITGRDGPAGDHLDG